MKRYTCCKGFHRSGSLMLPPWYQFLSEQYGVFLIDHADFQRNSFIMTRLQPGNRLLEKLDEELRGVLREHDLDPVRADDKMYMPDRNLWNNVCDAGLRLHLGLDSGDVIREENNVYGGAVNVASRISRL